MSINTTKICVIIPAYNESKTIFEIVQKIKIIPADIIVIDDGSFDNTAKLASKAGAYVIHHEKNIGKGKALIDGFEFAIKKGYEIFITLDGDGQHNPDDILSFIEAYKSTGAELIIGNRLISHKKMPFIRYITNILMSKFISFIIKQKIPDTQCGYRLLTNNIASKLNLSSCRYEIESEMIIKAARSNVKILSIPIRCIYKGETSNINSIIDTLRFFRFIIKALFTKSR